MAGDDLRQHVEVSDDDRTVATAEVTTSEGSGGTARVSLRAEPGHITPGRRASLVDAVLDLPEVQESARVEAAFRLGDSESLHRLQERCEDVSTRPAGWSALVDANLPSSRARRSKDVTDDHRPADLRVRVRGMSCPAGRRRRARLRRDRRLLRARRQHLRDRPPRHWFRAASGASSRSTAATRKWLSSRSPSRCCARRRRLPVSADELVRLARQALSGRTGRDNPPCARPPDPLPARLRPLPPALRPAWRRSHRPPPRRHRPRTMPSAREPGNQHRQLQLIPGSRPAPRTGN